MRRRAAVGVVSAFLCWACARPNPADVAPAVMQQRAAFTCTPEWEGRFVGGSSGALLNISFRGTLLCRTPDGRVKPAKHAVFIQDERAPRALRLDRAGRFNEFYGLSWDEHQYCRGGKVAAERSVDMARILVRVIGCKDSIMSVGEAGHDAVVTLECGIR